VYYAALPIAPLLYLRIKLQQQQTVENHLTTREDGVFLLSPLRSSIWRTCQYAPLKTTAFLWELLLAPPPHFALGLERFGFVTTGRSISWSTDNSLETKDYIIILLGHQLWNKLVAILRWYPPSGSDMYSRIHRLPWHGTSQDGPRILSIPAYTIG